MLNWQEYGGKGGDLRSCQAAGSGDPRRAKVSKKAGFVTIGTTTGCDKLTYVECFYSRELLQIDGSISIDKDQFALLIIAVFFDISGRNRTSSDRLRYDTPFWDTYGDASGDACYEGECYYRAEVNYFAQGMWSAANGQSLKYGETIVDLWKEQYGGAEPSAGTLYWFRAGYVLYQFLSDIFE